MIVVFVLVSSARADVIHVDGNCPGPGSGTAGDPYCSIQGAIDNAVDMDDIVVAPGIYLETIDFLGKAITLRGSDGPDVTIIDAGGAAGAGSVVVCNSGEGPNTVIEGFTVTGGTISGMLNDSTSPTVIGCVFSNNRSQAGGGMFNNNGSPTIINCTFDGNLAILFPNSGLGGGMANLNSSPMLIGCTFRGNVAAFSLGAGGGIFNDRSNPIIMNCLFHANSAINGSGMNNDHSNPTVANCSFTGNSSGIAIVNFSSNPALTNCILWSNDSGQIVDFSPSSSTISYSDVEGGWSGVGSNNIDADPLFVNPSNCCVLHSGTGCEDLACELAVCAVEPTCCDDFWDAPCADLAVTLCESCPNDFSLSPGSPCVDAGDNDAVPAGIDTDLDGNPRLLDVPETPDTGNGDPPIVDMGAYESLGGGCLALTSQEVVCHPDGTTFTLEVAGVSACTGDAVTATFTGSGGAVGDDLCFTMLIDDDQGGFCCSSQVCVPVPDCSEALADLDGDGVVGVMDLMLLLAQYGPCPGCWADMNHDGIVGVTDLLLVLGNWG